MSIREFVKMKEEDRRKLINRRIKANPQKYVDISEEFCVHPDMREAFAGFTGDKDSFKRVFKRRDHKVLNNEKYWMSDHDIEMMETARENTENYIMKTGDKWPSSRRRRRK